MFLPDAATDVQEIKQRVDLLCSLALNIPTEDAQELVNEIDRTMAFMPLTDPTGYKQIMFTADGHMDVARAFLVFRRQLAQIIATSGTRVQP